MKIQSLHVKTGFCLVLITAMLFGMIVIPTQSVAAAGTVLFAKPAATGSGNCSSWADACTLQSALTNAVSGDEIWVMQGTYVPTTGTDRMLSFQLKSGVAVYGGFAGTETSRDQRNATTNLTILSGEIGAAGTANNTYRVVVGSGTDSTAILDGFTITAGNADGSYPDNAGGGMFNKTGSPTLNDVTFSGNSAQWGGGMSNVTSTGRRK